MTEVSLNKKAAPPPADHANANGTRRRNKPGGGRQDRDGRPGGPARTDATDFWSRPAWGFPQAIPASIALIAPAAIAQALFPDLRAGLPGVPWNWIIVFGPIVLFAMARRLIHDNPLINGLGSVPMAIVSLMLLAIITLPGAIWPQDGRSPGWIHALGMDHVFSSLPYIAAMALVLINISIAVGKRAWPLRRTSARFMLVHLGLLIAIGGALAGTGSLQRLRLPLMDGAGPSNLAIDSASQQIALPFAARLEQFRLEHFPPTLSVVERQMGTTDDWVPTPGSAFVDADFSESIAGLQIEVVEWLPEASVEAGIPRAFPEKGAGPAARIRVTQNNGLSTPPGVLAEGWVHAETTWGEELWVPVDDATVIMMNPPLPRVFESTVQLMTPETVATPETVEIRVNEPVHYAGWRLYQLDYESELGALARYSVLEAVRDPAYPVVALGCWLIIAGMGMYWWQAASAVARGTRSALMSPHDRGNTSGTDHETMKSNGGAA